MITMRPLSLYLKNFKSFLEETYVEFKENALTLLSGHNYDTNGSSASGKTSLLEGLAFNLGYCSLSLAQAKTWGTEESAETMGIYDCQGRRLKISRSQKLRVWIDEEEVEGSAAYKQQKIEQLIGCNLEILQILTYHPQRVSGQFLNQTDSEKKDFLTQILGLELFETAVEKTEKELHEKIRESGLSVREFEIYERQYELLNEREFLENISIRTLSEYEYELKNIYETIEMLSKRISYREQLIEEAQKTYEEHTQQSREFFQEEMDHHHQVVNTSYRLAYEEEKEKLDRLYTQLCMEKDKADQVKKTIQLFASHRDQLNEVEQEILAVHGRIQDYGEELLSQRKHYQILQTATCYTCEAPLGNNNGDLAERKQKEIDLLQERIRQKEDELQYLYQERDRLLPLLQETPSDFPLDPFCIPSLEKQVVEQEVKLFLLEKEGIESDLLNSIPSYREAREELKKMTSSLQAEEEKRCHEIETLKAQERVDREEIGVLKREEKGLLEKISHIQQTNQEIDRRNQELKNAREKAEQDLEARVKKKEEIEKEIQKEQDFLKLIGKDGFLGFIFDEFLQEVSTLMNEYLSKIPNVCFITIQFVSEIVTQKGIVKRNIKPIFLTTTSEVSSWHQFSGGQKSSIDLAMGLALHRVICHRLAVKPGWLILDEVFEGQDIVTKEACLEIIKEFAENKLVIVVDHASEFKEMFEQHLLVTSSQGRSRIENR